MGLKSLETLPKAHPRTIVPADVNLGDWAQVEPLFIKLEEQAAGIKTLKALQQWILDTGELGAALDEEGAKRYINMTCQTDDPEIEKSYLQFVEDIDPKSKPHWQKLKELFLAHP